MGRQAGDKARKGRPGGGSAGRAAAGGQPPSGAGDRGRRPGGAAGGPGRAPAAGRIARALNPRRPPTRARAARFAVVCAAVALLLTAVGLSRGRDGWQPTAIMLGILALLWGIRAATMR
jgi:hypothetical protein